MMVRERADIPKTGGLLKVNASSGSSTMEAHMVKWWEVPIRVDFIGREVSLV
jgi:hypothetical protein